MLRREYRLTFCQNRIIYSASAYEVFASPSVTMSVQSRTRGCIAVAVRAYVILSSVRIRYKKHDTLECGISEANKTRTSKTVTVLLSEYLQRILS